MHSKHPSENTINNLTAIILAGGRGSRLGGQDKGLVVFRDKPMVEHVLEKIKPYCSSLLISANRNQRQYAQYGYPVISDQSEDSAEKYQGPLAGIHACLQTVSTDYAITSPCDTPFIAIDYVSRMQTIACRHPGRLIAAKSNTGLEPLFLLLPVDYKSALADYLAQGQRKASTWIQQQNPVLADFSQDRGITGMFRNINTQEDLQ